MSIPTQFDRDLTEVQNSADLVVMALRTLRHSAGPRARQYDVDRMRRNVWEHLQAFADMVIEIANANQ